MAEGRAPVAFEEAYPPRLRDAERERLAERPKWQGNPPGEWWGGKREGDPVVGFALSGGGIRSATFCLGVFQALARRGLLGAVDFLSTVSGGGYFGSFLGRLFCRDYVGGPGDVEEILDPAQEMEDAGRGIVRFLRMNGRYLSPRGAGDLLLAVAVLVRNFVAVHVVTTTILLFLFLLARLGTFLVQPYWDGWGVEDSLLFSERLWWSPWIAAALVPLTLLAFPAGWAYWLVGGSGGRVARQVQIHPLAGWALAVVLGGGASIMWARFHWFGGVVAAVGALLVVTGVLTLCFRIGAWAYARRRYGKGPFQAVREGMAASWKRLAGLRLRGADREPRTTSERERLFRDQMARNSLSRAAKWGLLVSAWLFGFGVLDTFGQTLYVLLVSPAWTIGSGLAVVSGALAGSVGFFRRVVQFFGRSSDDGRPRLPARLLAGAGALLVIVPVLTLLSCLSHAFAWEFGFPRGQEPLCAAWSASGEEDAGAAASGSRACVISPSESTPEAETWPVFLALAITGLFSVVFGRTWPFLNRSSHHSLYTARLVRAYLGASNGRRRQPGASLVTEPIPGDDLDAAAYWPPARSDRSPWRRGAPLHIVNTTINETLDSRTGLQQQDRKGLNLAVGPAGLSASVRHHAVFEDPPPDAPPRAAVQVFPPRLTAKDETFRVFEYGVGTGPVPYRGEELSIGGWVGISGAAFTTGLGWRTSLSLSLLTGMGNVRLGYWWRSRVRPFDRGGQAYRGTKERLSRIFGTIFPVQYFFLLEFLARFRGVARHAWYLSDGGHFENLGAYELIRRRLPRIVVVDAEMDPDCAFPGLANLVRKARMDLGAEITFLDEDEIRETLGEGAGGIVGALPHLAPGFWSLEGEREPPDPRARKRWRRSERGCDKASLAHAALARVHYLDGRTADSLLLYLKPTMTGDESADLVQYASAHPTFPHQTTVDQFFDEEQWESYRKLGYHIGTEVFRTAPSGRGFLPHPASAGGSDAVKGETE